MQKCGQAGQSLVEAIALYKAKTRKQDNIMKGLRDYYSGVSLTLKKVLVLIAALALCGSVLISCASEDEETFSATNADPAASAGAEGQGGNGGATDSGDHEAVTTENIAEFVTVGQYKGIYYDAVPVEAVTEEDIDNYIKQNMSQAASWVEVTDRAVLPFDTVIIDYEGFLDGVPFPGGADQNADLVIGSGQFIPGFEEQIIGRQIGEEFDIFVTFPEAYHSPGLAGQDVVFKINLNAIYAEVLPELTDDYVQENMGVDSVAEFRVMIRERLEQERELAAENNISYQVWSTIVDNTTFHKYPQGEIELRMDMAYMELQYMAMMYNMDTADFVAYITNGMSIMEFIEYELRPSAINDVEYSLVLRAVAVKEGIFVTDEEFDEAVRGYVAEYGYDNEEHFLSTVGEHAVHIVLLTDRVTDIVISNAIQR